MQTFMDEVQFDEGGAVVQMRTASAVAANRKETKDKKGEIVLVKPARVGDTILLAGTYTFQHVVSAGQNIDVHGSEGDLVTDDDQSELHE